VFTSCRPVTRTVPHLQEIFLIEVSIWVICKVLLILSSKCIQSLSYKSSNFHLTSKRILTVDMFFSNATPYADSRELLMLIFNLSLCITECRDDIKLSA
jgi:hypothetical protein